MTERTQLLVYIGFATLVIVIFIAALLIMRGGHGPETKAVLNAIEGQRNQLDVLEQTHEAEHRTMREGLNWLKARFERWTK